LRLVEPSALTTLPNGLRVISAPLPHLSRAHVALYTRVGSRFETLETNGISHFLEHMLYRGTPRLKSAHEVNEAFEAIGGSLYAVTHADFGIFSVTLPPESIDQASALLGEVLGHPTFPNIEIEKGIVREEILEDLDDDGRQIDADNLSRALIFGSTHPLGFTITGDTETVSSFTPALLAAHHQKHYTATNSVLVYSGNISDTEAERLAARDFSHFAKGEVIVGEAHTAAQKKARVKVVENMSSQTELRVCFRARPQSDHQRRALDMLMRVIDDGMSTRLYHRICDDKGLCYDVSAGFDGYEDDGVIDFAAGVLHSRASLVTNEILSLVSELRAHGPTASELEKARKRATWEMNALVDSVEDYAGINAGALLFRKPESLKQRLEALLSVTPEDIRTTLLQVARPENLNVVAVGLLENGEDRRLTETVQSFRAS